MGPNGQVERREKLLLNLPEGAIIHTAKLDTPWTSENPVDRAVRGRNSHGSGQDGHRMEVGEFALRNSRDVIVHETEAIPTSAGVVAADRRKISLVAAI